MSRHLVPSSPSPLIIKSEHLVERMEVPSLLISFLLQDTHGNTGRRVLLHRLVLFGIKRTY